VTAGYSTQGVRALSTQLRLFGSPRKGLRYFLEGSAVARGGNRIDVFSSANSYAPGARVEEAYVEQTWGSPKLSAGLRAGQFRTPFGQYYRSDYGYNGFLRPPVTRSTYYWGVGSHWREGGVNAFVAVPHLRLEGSVGYPLETPGRPHSRLDNTVRLEGDVGPVILGASYARIGNPDYVFNDGGATFGALDLRWMRSGVQVKGEYLWGTNTRGTHVRAWHVDLSVHKECMGPVTALARFEESDWFAGPFSEHTHRVTAGARVQINRNLLGQVNLVHDHPGPRSARPAVDFALTYSFRR
jgi:hypothetical protein